MEDVVILRVLQLLQLAGFRKGSLAAEKLFGRDCGESGGEGFGRVINVCMVVRDLFYPPEVLPLR